jgi:hypothetical protein
MFRRTPALLPGFVVVAALAYACTASSDGFSSRQTPDAVQRRRLTATTDAALGGAAARAQTPLG